MRFLILLLLSANAFAQHTVEPPAPLVVMNIAAHPDDEDGRTLTYYRHAKNAIAYSVIFTRGEGGQNEIGPELYAELGALRTDETERAARILGTQVFFLNYEDFGYSKSAAESFEKWGGEDAVTARLVYLIRKLKPDILFTNHDTVTVWPGAQHGHHQAAGIATYRAFELAADPEYHPEQLDEPGIYLWQPSRLFLRSYRRPDSYDVAVPVSAINPDTGESYSVAAMRALSEHATQGMDFFVGNRWRGAAASTYFTQFRTSTRAPLDTLDLVAGLPKNTEAQPDISYLIDSGRLPVIPEECVTTEGPFVVQGRTFSFSWPDSLLAGDQPVSWQFFGPSGFTVTLPVHTDSMYLGTIAVPEDLAPTWPRDVHQYDRFRSRPPFYYVARDSATGVPVASGYLPVHITPKVVVRPVEDIVLMAPGLNEIAVEGHVFDRFTKCVFLIVSVYDQGKSEPIAHHSVTHPINDDGSFKTNVSLELPPSLQARDYRFEVEARLGKIHRVSTTGVARALNVRVAKELQVGVVESYDGSLSQAVRVLGIEPLLVDSAMLAQGDFGDLQTILVDIRGYFVRPDLRAHNDKLLDWVAQGGHLIVNYQKTFEWNEQYADPFDDSKQNPAGFAPYPLALGRQRVTREDAQVTIFQPEHVLFHRPNRIEPADWDDWVQERGLYFPSSYDDRYVELFSMSDPGEAPLTGSTLLADYGEGTYLYTALGWYRQLQRYHPGAFKVFANMISLPILDGR